MHAVQMQGDETHESRFALHSNTVERVSHRAASALVLLLIAGWIMSEHRLLCQRAWAGSNITVVVSCLV